MRFVAGCVLLWAVGPRGAAAHAALTRAEPAAGARLSAPPTKIALVFSEALELGFSLVQVTDESGKRVDQGELKADGGANSVEKPLTILKPGTYRVKWHAVSTDTHRSSGSYSFSVAP